MVTLGHIRIALQLHGEDSSILTRKDDHSLTYKPLSTKTPQSDARQVYVDKCFTADATATDVYTECGMERMVDLAVKGHRSGFFVAGVGKKFQERRTAVFMNILGRLKIKLEEEKEKSNLEMSFAQVAVTDAKLVDLLTDKPLELNSHVESLRKYYQMVESCDLLEENVRRGCPLPYIMAIRLEKKRGARSIGYIFLADLNTPSFNVSADELVLQRRGPSLSLSLRGVRKIADMLSNSGIEGPVPYEEYAFTTLCRDYIGGSGSAIFYLHMDAREDVFANEIAGAVEFAETLRKVKTLELRSYVDPRVTELEKRREKLIQQIRELEAFAEQQSLEYEKKLCGEQERNKQEVATLQRAYSEAKKERQAEFAETCARLEGEFTDKCARMEAEIKNVEAEKGKALEECDKKWRDEMEALRLQHEADVRKLQVELEKIQLRSRIEITKALNDKAEVDEALRRSRVEILNMGNDYQNLQLERDGLQRALASTQMQVEELEDINEQTLASVKELENRNASLIADLAAQTTETEAARRDANDNQASYKAAIGEKEVRDGQLTEALAQIRDLTKQIDELRQNIASRDSEIAELKEKSEGLSQKLAVSEARLEEARRAYDILQQEKDAAVAESKEVRKETSGEIERMRQEVDITREEIKFAREEIKALRVEMVNVEKAGREELTELQKEINRERKEAEKYAREAERSEGRFEGEREGWKRERENLERERDRLIEEVQELRLEVTRARVAGAGEEGKIKTWFERLEADNRQLREEVAEVKTLKRQRRESDMHVVRVQTRLDRLEAENHRIAEEAAAKEREWAREKARLEREAKAAAVQARSAVASKRQRANKKVVEEGSEVEEQHALAEAEDESGVDENVPVVRKTTKRAPTPAAKRQRTAKKVVLQEVSDNEMDVAQEEEDQDAENIAESNISVPKEQQKAPPKKRQRPAKKPATPETPANEEDEAVQAAEDNVAIALADGKRTRTRKQNQWWKVAGDNNEQATAEQAESENEVEEEVVPVKTNKGNSRKRKQSDESETANNEGVVLGSVNKPRNPRTKKQVDEDKVPAVDEAEVQADNEVEVEAAPKPRNSRKKKQVVEPAEELTDATNSVADTRKPRGRGRKQDNTAAAELVAENEAADISVVEDVAEEEQASQVPNKPAKKCTTRKRKMVSEDVMGAEVNEGGSGIDIDSIVGSTAAPSKGRKRKEKKTDDATDFHNDVEESSTQAAVEETEETDQVATQSAPAATTQTNKRKKNAVNTGTGAKQFDGPMSVDDILGLSTGVGAEPEKGKKKGKENQGPKGKGKGKGKGKAKAVVETKDDEEFNEDGSDKESLMEKKKRKLNPKRKTSMDVPEEIVVPGERESAPARHASSATTTSVPAAPKPILSLSERAAALAGTEGRTIGGIRARLPNLNASGRLEFKKRPGMDPERMKAILKGYGYDE